MIVEVPRRVATLALMDRAEPLVRNLVRLGIALEGQRERLRIAVMGPPGVGKSSLLKALSLHRVVPVPAVGLENDVTRWSDDDTIELIGRCPDALWIDVPGHGTALHPVKQLADFLPFREFDVSLYVVAGKILEADLVMMRALRRWKDRVILVRNFADGLSGDERKKVAVDIQTHLAVAVGAQGLRPLEKCSTSDMVDSVPLTFVDCRRSEGLQELRQHILSRNTV